eukprot:TRINITY_DN2186_c0_g1_i1.p3 TRINITY_DN2186_c0_g1~~TRINITY_DN2186_c0_g1_i1.p3  ORF type:complete len:181 (-),score=48.27 TRINITY_DN2186_c0_g1_i1:269-811(-)
MAGFGGGGGGAKKAPKKKAAASSAASTPAAREDGSTKVRADKLYARLVADAGATEHAVLVQAPGGAWKRVGDLAAVEAALPSGVSGGVRAHKREILDAAKRTWADLAVAAGKGHRPDRRHPAGLGGWGRGGGGRDGGGQGRPRRRGGGAPRDGECVQAPWSQGRGGVLWLDAGRRPQPAG